MRKPAKFRPQNITAKNSCVRFGILREWVCTRRSLRASVFRRPASGGFSFCYVIGFPSNSCEHTMASIRNRIWAIGKVCSKNRQAASAPRPAAVDVCGFGQANVALTLAPFGFSVCMRSVWTKAVFWFVAGREPRRFRQHKNAARTLLHQVANPAILGVLRALILPFRKPASAGFLFSGHRNSFSHYARGEAIRICLAMEESARRFAAQQAPLQPSIDL